MERRKPREKKINGVLIRRSLAEEKAVVILVEGESVYLKADNYTLFQVAQKLIEWAWYFEEKK